MLKKPPSSDSKSADQDSATSAALKCAYSLMQQRIISNPNDMMGILLFGTEQSKFQDGDGNSRGQLSYPHCYLLMDLDVPSAADMKNLRNTIDDKAESDMLLRPSSESVTMANVLFCANRIFTTRAPNFSSRRLFLVTDNDEPHAGNRVCRSSAIVRAKDLYDLGVVIELFPISQPGHSFDRTKFYNDIVYLALPIDPEAPAPISSVAKDVKSGDGITLLQSLLSSINSKAVPRRALFSNLPLEIGPGFRISVKGFIIFKRQEPARSCYVWLKGEKAQIATGKTALVADDTARTVEKSEVRKAYRFGGETITFAQEELKKIRNFGEPIIRIVGFKPQTMLPIWASTKHSTFIYPSEEDYVGSIRVFSALQQKLLSDKSMAIAWFIARRNAAPVMAALFPGSEKYGESGDQTLPAGLWIIPLPFADDMRQNPESTLVRSPDSLIDKMRVIIQQLQLPRAVYDPQRYLSPALQWHYRILQALALEEDLPEKPEDKTIPRYKQIHKRAGEYVLDWGRELDEQYRAWQQEHVNELAQHRGAPKRSAPASSIIGGSLSKRVKNDAANQSGDTMTQADVKALFDKNKIAALSLPQLKAFAKHVDLGTGGRKAEIVERIEAFFERK